MEERYCGNCGHELSEDARFCSECGQPVHETARVPTPEADVPVPPVAGQHSAGLASPRTEASPQQQGSWLGRGFGGRLGASVGWTLGSCITTVVLIVVLSTLLFVGCAALLAVGSNA